jgi:hypothetical protein
LTRRSWRIGTFWARALDDRETAQPRYLYPRGATKSTSRPTGLSAAPISAGVEDRRARQECDVHALTEANWAALVAIGHGINERLLDCQLHPCACAPDAATLQRIVLPFHTTEDQPVAVLRFGDPRVQALLTSPCAFSHLPKGVTKPRSLRTFVTGSLPGYRRAR